ncbi:uncharacterized protein TRIADDRAFT_54350 [Trichoplax adhaerens]|uniref:Cation-dependent mannose-6-phosphate receptor n=1 Tax=Trichoplax adhaerens TaxID=10228 RepID=B3RRS8_TRIAD|nr:predicted protein [Trichoplax adhaerens]EDV26922.1 predicted protein [Trichoplax adhaerens]|eukprot:XP_002110918.1 predicted protein [Trichoplax adhaerens]
MAITVALVQYLAIIIGLSMQLSPADGASCGLTSFFDTKNLTHILLSSTEIVQPGDPVPGMTQQYGIDENTNLLVGQYSDLAWQGGQTSFSVQYSNGTTVHNGNQYPSLSVNMIFRCAEKAIWSAKLNEYATVPTEANINAIVDRDTGKYQFIFNYAGACRTLKPASSLLSGGSVLLIVFFSLLGAYLIFGIIIQSSRGARGYELIPNVEFWSKIPGCIRALYDLYGIHRSLERIYQIVTNLLFFSRVSFINIKAFCSTRYRQMYKTSP